MPVYFTLSCPEQWRTLGALIRGKKFFFPTLPKRASRSARQGFLLVWKQVIVALERQIITNRDIFCCKGVDLSDDARQYFSSVVTPGMETLNAQKEALERILAIHPPAFCLAQHALGPGYALGEICQQRGIPALLISHGSHTVHDDAPAKNEWAVHARTLFHTHYPAVALQTPLAAQFHKHEQVKSQGIATGPLLLATPFNVKESRIEIKNRLFPACGDKSIILHAGSPKAWRGYRPWVYETVDEYLNGIIDLIAATESIPDVFLAIRFRPDHGLTEAMLHDLLPQARHFAIYSSGSFCEYLLASDLLVSYSSTTLEEALSQAIPVLQYDAQNKYCHLPAVHFRKGRFARSAPAYYVGSKQHLEASLRWIKTHHLDQQRNDHLDWSSYRMTVTEPATWLRQLDPRL